MMRFALLGLLAVSMASEGDNLPEFKTCVAYCDVLRCNGFEKYSQITIEKQRELIKDDELQGMFSNGVPIWNQLLGWDCLGNCDYECQRIVTNDRVHRGLEVYQFHGKWPFIRVWGVQELFSTIFSVGNFIPNYMGFKLIKKHWIKERDAEYKTLYFSYIIVSVVAMCAWTFSSIFHLKDTWNRERLDYFFAGMTVLSGFHSIVIRYFHLFKSPSKTRLFSLTCVLLYLCHVMRLLWDWSYSYNMEVNVIFGIIQYILWVTLSIQQFNNLSNPKKHLMDNVKDRDVNWSLIPCGLVACVIFGMSFELFDFSPVGDLVDAHAMWHFVTIWPTIFWYPFMVKDVEYLKSVKNE